MLKAPNEKKGVHPPASPVKYRPSETLRWLNAQTEEAYERVKQSAEHIKSEPQIAQKLRQAAGMIIDISKSAVGEVAKRSSDASEITFYDDEVLVSRLGKKLTIPYKSFKQIKKQKDKYTLVHSGGNLTYKPYATIVAGRRSVPVGWVRNKVEVPYETLFDEWAARCRLNIEE